MAGRIKAKDLTRWISISSVRRGKYQIRQDVHCRTTWRFAFCQFATHWEKLRPSGTGLADKGNFEFYLSIIFEWTTIRFLLSPKTIAHNSTLITKKWC